MQKKTALIIGAGPAGLTAAYELLRHTDIQPIVIETDNQVGGISKTVVHNGNRMDLGGHRFFSKSDWVMNWWQSILPFHDPANDTATISYQNQQREISAMNAAAAPTACMLLRPRLSRIYFLRNFFDYPIKMNGNTIANLGPVRLIRIGCSYIWIKLFPHKQETSLEDFIINRFGRELYLTFFKDYTEKVWGVACNEISAEWGAQRIKGLSVTAALRHALKQAFQKLSSSDIQQKQVETSLIEQFLYPRLGPGQMWESVSELIQKQGATVELGWKVTALQHQNGRIISAELLGPHGESKRIEADYFISTMPVRDLVLGLQPAAPQPIRDIASALPYRDFMTAGVLVKRIKQRPDGATANLKDNWIYIQEKEVKLGRLQVFNNWCPDLVADQNTVWLGLEYFCNQGDELWQMADADFAKFAVKELAKIDLIEEADVLDTHVVRVPKAYPAYFGAYAKFGEVRNYADSFSNLFLIGRNGMHRYNNQDHSMLTAKLAVEAIKNGSTDKSALWAVNVDDEYHEAKRQD